MTEQTIDKPMMASEIIAALSNPRKNLGNFLNHKYAHGIVQKLRVELVQSKKFVIDDSLLYNLVQASMVKPEAFKKAIELAKPPFPNMFIEFNEVALLKAYKKFYATQYPALIPFIDAKLKNGANFEDGRIFRKGYHIRADDDETEFVPWLQVPNVGDFEVKGKWVPAIFSIRVKNVSDKEMDFEKRVQEVKSNKDKWSKAYKYRYNNGVTNGSDMVTFPGISFIGEDYFHYYSDRFAQGIEQRAKEITAIRHNNTQGDFIYGTHTLIGKGYNKSACHRVASQGNFASICSKFTYGHSYMWSWATPEKDLKSGKFDTDDQFHRQGIELSYQFIQGQAKFLIAALAMFNFDHIVYKKKTKGTTKVQHISRGQRIPFNEYSLMTIELPKPRGVQKYEREFTGHGSPKCEHWRCGHWRRYRDRFGNVTKRTWIKAKKVGNKAYGTKQTEYKLNKAQGE